MDKYYFEKGLQVGDAFAFSIWKYIEYGKNISKNYN